MIVVIGFSSAKSDTMLFARGIEALEKRPFSHVFIKYKDPFCGIEMIFQASHGMVNHCSFETFCSGNDVIKTYELDFNNQQFLEFYIFMLKTLGAPYDWKQLIGIFLKKIFRGENPFAKDNKLAFICSELGAWVAKIKGIPMPKDMNSITPSDLDKILQDNI